MNAFILLTDYHKNDRKTHWLMAVPFTCPCRWWFPGPLESLSQYLPNFCNFSCALTFNAIILFFKLLYFCIFLVAFQSKNRLPRGPVNFYSWARKFSLSNRRCKGTTLPFRFTNLFHVSSSSRGHDCQSLSYTDIG